MECNLSKEVGECTEEKEEEFITPTWLIVLIILGLLLIVTRQSIYPLPPPVGDGYYRIRYMGEILYQISLFIR